MSSGGPKDPDRYVPSERLTLAALERLEVSSTRVDVLEALWDLRDNAYDLPEAWESFTAVWFLQLLAELLDVSADDATNWDYFGAVIGQALTKARSDLPTAGDA